MYHRLVHARKFRAEKYGDNTTYAVHAWSGLAPDLNVLTDNNDSILSRNCLPRHSPLTPIGARDSADHI